MMHAFIQSLKSGGVGLNLTNANTVFMVNDCFRLEHLPRVLKGFPIISRWIAGGVWRVKIKP